METGTRTITDIHIGPPPSVNTKQTHKYCFFRNLKYLKDLLPVFPDLKQKNVLEEERGKKGDCPQVHEMCLKNAAEHT